MYATDTTLRDLRDTIRSLRNQITRMMDDLYDGNQDREYNENLIVGLCPSQDSCEQCRAARRADPAYQLYLRKKSMLEAIRSRGAVFSDLESRTLGEDEQVTVLLAWRLAYRDGIANYKKLYC